MTAQSGPRHRRVGSRTKARNRALDILFESEMRRQPLEQTLAERRAAGTPLNDYTVTLVDGVAARQEAIDTVIADRAEGWTLARMPAVDRNILRLAAYELLYSDDVPVKVVLNEAIELGKRYSTAQSGAFINGILDKIKDQRPAAPAPSAARAEDPP